MFDLETEVVMGKNVTVNGMTRIFVI